MPPGQTGPLGKPVAAADKPANVPAWSPQGIPNQGATRPIGGPGSAGSGNDFAGVDSKAALKNRPVFTNAVKTNIDEPKPADVAPLVAASPNYMAQGNNWLLWLLVFLIALFLAVLEIRRRMDARVKKKARMGMRAN